MRTPKIVNRHARLRSVMRNRIETSSAPSTAIVYSRSAERRREHDEHRVRQRQRAAVFEAQREQLAEHEPGGEERERVGAAVRVDDVRDGARDEPEHADEDDPAAAIHRAAPESRGSSRISCYSAAFGGRKRPDQPFWSARS